MSTAVCSVSSTNERTLVFVRLERTVFPSLRGHSSRCLLSMRKQQRRFPCSTTAVFCFQLWAILCVLFDWSTSGEIDYNTWYRRLFPLGCGACVESGESLQQQQCCSSCTGGTHKQLLNFHVFTLLGLVFSPEFCVFCGQKVGGSASALLRRCIYRRRQ